MNKFSALLLLLPRRRSAENRTELELGRREEGGLARRSLEAEGEAREQKGAEGEGGSEGAQGGETAPLEERKEEEERLEEEGEEEAVPTTTIAPLCLAFLLMRPCVRLPPLSLFIPRPSSE